MTLSGKVAVVTGAASGIGRATTELLVERGASVVALDLQEERLQASYAGIEKISSIAVDVTDSAAIRRIFTQVADVHKRLDILVNAAGIFAPTRQANQKIVETNVKAVHDIKSGRMPTFDYLDETSDEDFRRVMEVNLFSQFYCLRSAVPLMRASGGGSVVNISSVSALMGVAMPLYYPASKAGVLGLTRAAASELAPYNIRVNAVAPGSVDTPLMHEQPEEVVQFLVGMQPIKRLAAPAELARMIVFLSSDEDSGFVTGQTISPNGGMYM
ncbi:SDR family NAD(P)-dependent oxidoreductase [Rhizobium rhizogenes]|uniref:SDR family NAD(P)-dependent oxidoreductase n=1 Tax=Rhizobium rhizogenes TaxID=359 RepID=UPI001573A54E|nr:SDR family NAD(P)-dependent oxidoreductase [Rhizobium rhizogenes]